MSGGMGCPWKQRSPTWRMESAGNLKWHCTMGRKVAEGGVASNGVPFMAPLDYDPHLITFDNGEL